MSDFPTEKPLEIIIPLKDTTAMEKDSVSFTCILSKPDVTSGRWIHGEAELTVSERIKIATDGTQQSLTVDDLALVDAGLITYEVDTVSTSATLVVEGRNMFK